MKVKLISDRSNGNSGFTVGKVYEVYKTDRWFHYLKDDDGNDGRIIPKGLSGFMLDWEIVEE